MIINQNRSTENIQHINMKHMHVIMQWLSKKRMHPCFDEVQNKNTSEYCFDVDVYLKLYF